jgi:hypothetical protein
MNNEPARVCVDRVMLHDLVNHLTIALGQSDLLLMEVDADVALRTTVVDIREACQRAVDLVEGWRSHLPQKE